MDIPRDHRKQVAPARVAMELLQAEAHSRA
jgi:hypothetical protein